MSLVKNISFNMHGGCFFDQPPDVCTFGHIVDHQGVEALRFRLLTGQDGVGGVQLAFASRRVLAQAAHTDRPQSNYQRLKIFFFFLHYYTEGNASQWNTEFALFGNKKKIISQIM